MRIFCNRAVQLNQMYAERYSFSLKNFDGKQEKRNYLTESFRH